MPFTGTTRKASTWTGLTSVSRCPHRVGDTSTLTITCWRSSTVSPMRSRASAFSRLWTDDMKICQEFHLHRDDLWATPANMYPVTQMGDLFDNGQLLNQKDYPNYENGGSFFHTTGLEIAARGAAGQASRRMRRLSG